MFGLSFPHLSERKIGLGVKGFWKMHLAQKVGLTPWKMSAAKAS